MHHFNLQNSLYFCMTNKFWDKRLFHMFTISKYVQKLSRNCKSIQKHVTGVLIIVLEECKHIWLQPIWEEVSLVYLDGTMLWFTIYKEVKEHGCKSWITEYLFNTAQRNTSWWLYAETSFDLRQIKYWEHTVLRSMCCKSRARANQNQIGLNFTTWIQLFKFPFSRDMQSKAQTYEQTSHWKQITSKH